MYRPNCSQLMLITSLVLQLVYLNVQVQAQAYSIEEQIHIGELYVDGDTTHSSSYARYERSVPGKLSHNKDLASGYVVVDANGFAHHHQYRQKAADDDHKHQVVGVNHHETHQQMARQQHDQPFHQNVQPHLAGLHNNVREQYQTNDHNLQPAHAHQASEQEQQQAQPQQQHHHHQQANLPPQNLHLNFQQQQVNHDANSRIHDRQPHHQYQQEHLQLEERSYQQQLQYLYEQHNQQLQTHIHQHTKIEYSESSFEDGELSEFYMHNFETSYHIAGVPIEHHASQSCNSIDGSSIMIMPNNNNNNLAEQTCGANSDHVPSFEEHNNKASRNSNVESFPLTPQHYHYESSLMTAIGHYWREISGLCLATAIFLNWVYVVLKRKFLTSGFSRHIIDVAAGGELQNSDRQSSSSTASSPKNSLKDNAFNYSAHDSAFEETASPLSLDGVDTTSSEGSSLSSRHRSISSSPHTPFLSSSLPNSSLNSTFTYTSDYISRYSSDFDSIQRLGRGGFGIVFEAKNKIDDCHYAVKRICLPLEKEARERVMREVRALAKLDHAGIVRYYNAWLETPPDEWLKQHDALLGIVHTRDGLSFPSTDGIYDDKNLNQNINGDQCDKFGASEDMSISEFFENKSRNKREHRANSYKGDYLKRNSSSPSLDIVFEGSGSIRLEAENGKENGKENVKETLKVDSGLHLEKVYLYIQMQLCRKDTLKDWLRTNCENRDKTAIFDFFYQIVDAVEYVHSQDLIHRDLKPSNIFFSLDGTLKIGDFGLCRAKTTTCVGSSLDLKEYSGDFSEAVHTEQVGTQLYMSPEQMNGLSYNHKVDIFAMGLILLELLVPFKTQMQRVNVLLKARNNMFSREFKKEHPDEHDLVRLLLDRRPNKRPTATAIKQHELLANAQLSQPVIERIYHRRRTISSNSSSEQCDT